MRHHPFDVNWNEEITSYDDLYKRSCVKKKTFLLEPNNP